MMKCVARSEKSWMEHGSSVENHSKTDFFRMLGKAQHMIKLVPPLNSIKELNIVKCSWGLVVPLYNSNVLGRRNPSGKGTI